MRPGWPEGNSPRPIRGHYLISTSSLFRNSWLRSPWCTPQLTVSSGVSTPQAWGTKLTLACGGYSPASHSSSSSSSSSPSAPRETRLLRTSGPPAQCDTVAGYLLPSQLNLLLSGSKPLNALLLHLLLSLLWLVLLLLPLSLCVLLLLVLKILPSCLPSLFMRISVAPIISLTDMRPKNLTLWPLLLGLFSLVALTTECRPAQKPKVWDPMCKSNPTVPVGSHA